MRGHSPWLMVLCVVGMGGVLFLPALGISLGSLFGLLLLLLCPLSHILMMRGGHGSHEPGHGPARREGTDPGAPPALPAGEAEGRKG